jgi:hypothetical protein
MTKNWKIRKGMIEALHKVTGRTHLQPLMYDLVEIKVDVIQLVYKRRKPDIKEHHILLFWIP